MNAHIGQSLRYKVRDEEGTQTPLGTLALRQRQLPRLRVADDGSRAPAGHRHPLRLGLYLRRSAGHRPSAKGTVAPVSGAGYTHAWLQAYLPGAGWVAFDPTNNMMGSGQLIRVGVARDPALASPMSGSWYGEAEAYEGMDATVLVRRTAG